jgi:hypothetical protein
MLEMFRSTFLAALFFHFTVLSHINAFNFPHSVGFLKNTIFLRDSLCKTNARVVSPVRSVTVSQWPRCMFYSRAAYSVHITSLKSNVEVAETDQQTGTIEYEGKGNLAGSISLCQLVGLHDTIFENSWRYPEASLQTTKRLL